MPAYCTPADLLAELGPAELAQVSTPDGASIVSNDLMRLVCNSGTTTDYAPDEVDAAVEALATLTGACLSASEDIDSYLLMRYTLPLSAPGATLKSWAKKIARYKLHRHLRIAEPNSDTGQHPIHRDYQGVLSLLQAVAVGKMSIGGGDPSPPITNTDATFESSALAFSRAARMGGAL